MESELIDAVRRGETDVVQSLIEKGVNVNYVPSRGKTPLAMAAAAGHISIMLALCNSSNDQGQDPNKNLDYYIFEDEVSPEGTEDLEWDTEMDGEEENADDVWSRQYRWYADILAKTAGLVPDQGRTCDVDLQDCSGRTALHYAVDYRQLDALLCLFDAGCKIDVSDADGLTPLHLAAMRGHEEIARMLICRSANVNRKTADKMAPLHYAAARGFVQMVCLLVEEGGAHVDPLDTSDRTPLMLAVTRGHLEAVRALIRYGAKLNIEEIHGYSPLCEAVWSKSVPLAELLLRSGAKLTQSHHLLHHAVRHRHRAMAELLLSLGGAYPNLRDDHGDTPLILAIHFADLGMVKLLLQYQASPSYTNSVLGVTPLVCALDMTDDMFERAVMLLCDFNVDLDQHCVGEFSCRSNALSLAIASGHAYKAAVLVRAGADVNAIDVNIMGLASRNEHHSLVCLLVAAGLDLSRLESLEYPKDFTKLRPEKSVYDWLTVAKFNAPRLTDLCRLVLRSRMRHRPLGVVPMLHIPSSLKTFLLLQDIYVERLGPDSKTTNEGYFHSLFGQ